MAAYAAEHADKVARLVLYGPQWLESSPATSSPPLGAYVAAPMHLARERMQTGAPDGRKHDLMPAGWFEAWSTAALATDQVGSRQNPPVLRSPAGVFQDRQEFWRQGKPYYDPQRITAPTLIAVAEWDRATPIEGAQELFRQLPSGPGKRLVEVGEGTHLLMLEKNRIQLFEEIQRGDPERVRVAVRENGGVASARNTAIALARGEFLVLLDGDDLWEPTFVERQLQMFSAHPDVDLVTSNGRFLGGPRHGKIVRPHPDPRPPISLATIISDEQAVYVMTMFRRRVVDAIGGFDGTLRTNEDFDFWFRAALAGYGFARNSEPLTWYRRRRGAASAVRRRCG